MATTPAPQVQGWHPGSMRIVAGLIGLVIVAIAAAALTVMLSGDGGDGLATSTGGSNANFLRPGAQLDGDGLPMAGVELPAATTAPGTTFFRPGAQVDGNGVSLAEVNPASNLPGYIQEHSSGIDAALFSFGEPAVASYVAEHDAGIDAVLGYEMSESVGPAPYIEEHDRLIDAVLGGTQ